MCRRGFGCDQVAKPGVDAEVGPARSHDEFMNQPTESGRPATPIGLKLGVSIIAALPLFTIGVPTILEVPGPDPQFLFSEELLFRLGPAVALFVVVGALVWVLRARVWSVLAMIASAVLWISAVFADLSQGYILWDGMDKDGNPIGGQIDFVLGPGAWLCQFAAALMLITAIITLVLAPRPPRLARPPAREPQDFYRSSPER